MLCDLIVSIRPFRIRSRCSPVLTRTSIDGPVGARDDACEHVRDCREPVRILDQDAPFFEAVDTIAEREVVLVRGRIAPSPES